MKEQTVRLPNIPPSVNNLFATVNTKRGGSRRVKTSEYDVWQQEAILRVRMAMKPVREYPAAVTVTVFAGGDFRKTRDIANVEKACTDAIVAAGILADDNVQYVWETHQCYRPLKDKQVKSYAVVRVVEGISIDLDMDVAA